MKFARILFVAAAMTVGIAGCTEKKASENIIAPKPVVKKPSGTVKMQNYKHQDNVEWLGQPYKINVERTADTSVQAITDDNGNKYYDNVIEVSITRPDNTEFFKKTFRKEDFAEYIDESYMKKSTLLGIVLEKAEGDNLIFAASVGAPDVLSDEYVPLIITLSKMGNISVRKDTRLDSNSDKPADEDEGV